MASRKQISTHNGIPSKGKTISAIVGTVLPPIVEQPHTTENTDSSPQEAATNV